jgi:hypothetical protein
VNAAGGKRSRAILKAFLDEDATALEMSTADPRADELRFLGTDDLTALEAIREIFAGTGLADDQEKVRRILRVRGEIQKEWGDARDSFLAIGRALLALEYALTKIEFARLRQGSERLFPFSDATATQLRQIARAVDGGRIPAEACPGSYGTAYQITLLTERQMTAARDRGLIRPDVTRREIIQLRREIGAVDTSKAEPIPSGRMALSHFRSERSHLVNRRSRIVEELSTIERRIAQLDLLLSPVSENAAEVTDPADPPNAGTDQD